MQVQTKECIPRTGYRYASPDKRVYTTDRIQVCKSRQKSVYHGQVSCFSILIFTAAVDIIEFLNTSSFVPEDNERKTRPPFHSGCIVDIVRKTLTPAMCYSQLMRKRKQVVGNRMSYFFFFLIGKIIYIVNYLHKNTGHKSGDSLLIYTKR